LGDAISPRAIGALPFTRTFIVTTPTMPTDCGKSGEKRLFGDMLVDARKGFGSTYPVEICG
jgi:hypothetical protein